MANQPTNSKHILFLFSDTGGGHRSAAEAIVEALQLEYGSRITTELLDFIKTYAPPPLNQAPAWYPYMVRVPDLWGVNYQLSDGWRRTRAVLNIAYPYTYRSIKRMFQDHPSDLIVSVHPLGTSQVLRAMSKPRPLFVTVVTDLVTTHAFWYEPDADLCIVPTEGAKRRAVKYRVPESKIRVVGLPVADRFCQPVQDSRALRQALGWPEDLPMTLLVGGGDGMGPLGKTAEAIAAARLPLGMAIVTGRNAKLKESLEARKWPVFTKVYGFVRNMPDMMQAADILVTKAGPGTICEALNAGLPMILYSRLPGQEDGNISYVVQEGAGIWAPEPDQIVTAVRTWLEKPDQYAQAEANCRRIARPHAARQIARLLGEMVGLD